MRETAIKNSPLEGPRTSSLSHRQGHCLFACSLQSHPKFGIPAGLKPCLLECLASYTRCNRKGTQSLCQAHTAFQCFFCKNHPATGAGSHWQELSSACNVVVMVWGRVQALKPFPLPPACFFSQVPQSKARAEKRHLLFSPVFSALKSLLAGCGSRAVCHASETTHTSAYKSFSTVCSFKRSQFIFI